MAASTFELTVQKSLAATPEEIWAAWSDPDVYDAVHGCHETEIDFRAGGTITTRFFPDRPTGEVFVLLEVDAPRRLVFAWEGHEIQRVTLEILPHPAGVDMAITQACGEDLGWITNGINGWALSWV